MAEENPLWYKDAVFYELHVKAFQDNTGDGIGDFSGLMDRLDYVESLGVDCIWLLPCYPSPLRDDGYDIADYYGVNPSYGDLGDFQRFIDEAHRRGLRVIADLVLNHTSDQHPWFQRARRAPKGSPERDFYVWSDTTELYEDARIIFIDTEPSNWTWDPVAGQYFWHRFFSHQPDLNWDNPAVEQAMFEVMDFWLDKGLDGFRADAIPYLIERDGTNCENLPETHKILKRLRTRIQNKYPGRILLAEANQWPDDVRPYFGDGDEFHMAFHFPLMPRIFMAVRQGTRQPIVEIISHTPDIPDSCQWCMFLRNHDELTLEMVTDEERDYMYQEYAADPRMRLNLGIRRRLAPLLDNDRRKIELVNSILLTMPGSPVIYYGDEIGMGDNIYLGDRDGVRTPMQWSPDRNGGFSRAESARLYAPVITDSVYGYQAINVEAQQKSPFSLLNWMRRLIAVRKEHPAFGRGTLEFLHPDNQHVLAYLREYEGDAILVVHNLSGSAQAVRLDLSRFSGSAPSELLGQTEFLAIDESPYALTLSPYGFFWFGIRKRADASAVRAASSEWAEQEEELAGATAGAGADVSPEWLQEQRWFRSKGRVLERLTVRDRVTLPNPGEAAATLALVNASYDDGGSECYLVAPGQATGTAASGAEAAVTGTARALLALIAGERSVPGASGTFSGHQTNGAAAEAAGALPVRPVGAEQSNTSLKVGEEWVLKIFRKIESGINPDVEISRFLTERTDFRGFPALGGWVDYNEGESSAAVAALFEYLPNQGDGWSFALRHLAALLSNASQREDAGAVLDSGAAAEYFAAVRELGEITAGFHLALLSAGSGEPAFEPHAVGGSKPHEWAVALQRDASGVLGDLRRRVETLPGAFPAALSKELAELLANESSIRHRLGELETLLGGKMLAVRQHGDYHLGQVLRLEGEPGWAILDFEGEPARELASRRALEPAMRDVAGMLRSFDYAAATALREHSGDGGAEEVAERWRKTARDAFLEGYTSSAAGSGLLPDDDDAMRRAVAVYELAKAVYELGYELNNRPGWISVPLRGLQRLLGGVAA